MYSFDDNLLEFRKSYPIFNIKTCSMYLGGQQTVKATLHSLLKGHIFHSQEKIIVLRALQKCSNVFHFQLIAYLKKTPQNSSQVKIVEENWQKIAWNC